MRTGWRVYSIRTTTGEVGSEYDPTSGSWSVELNKIEDFSITIKKSELLEREELWYSPWSGGVMFTFTGPDFIERPIVAGPIYDYGVEQIDTIELKCAGIRKIFENRTIWDDLSYTNLTYGEVAWRLCEHAMARTGGRLPITHGIAEETGSYQRTYEKWNLANNSIDKRWTELSEVINGPDIMFRPEWVDDDHSMVRWVMVHGTKLSPYIPQTYYPDFDTTAAAADTGAPSISSSGSHLRHRIWATGSGEGEGIARTFAENLDGVRRGMPFLEGVMSDSDQDDTAKLLDKAYGALDVASHMTDQVTFSVRANSEKQPLGSYFVGDLANVVLKGFLTVPDGDRNMRIIKANGDLGQSVTLDFQEAVME